VEVVRNDPYALPTLRGEPVRLKRRADHPDGEDIVATKRWLRNAPRPWAIDVFCGAGGLSLGLEEAGFTVVAACDSDAAAVETHRAAIGGLCYQSDLSDPKPFLDYLAEVGIRRVDVVAGGPPCQPFSRAATSKIRSLVAAGIRERADNRVDLWRSFAAIVDAIEPRAVIFENVPDMARWYDGAVLIGLMSALRERGYIVDARILDSFRYGVPQHHQRLFVIGVRNGRFVWPKATKLVTVADAISDLPVVPGGQRQLELPYKEPLTPFQRRARRGLPRHQANVISDHVTRAVRVDDAEAFSLLAPGQTYADLPAHLQRYRSDIFTDKYKRLSFDDVSRTVTAHIAKDGYWYIHPGQDRTLSIREAARLQTFPDRVRFAGHPTVQLRQIGNAVPPALSRAVGRRVRATLNTGVERTRTRTSYQSEFVAPLLRWHLKNGRKYPWRESSDPWLVLLSELFLRRKPSGSAGTAYALLARAAPSAAKTHQAPERLREALDALRLTKRLPTVLAIAEMVTNEFGGAVPENEADLRVLPGVGDYVSAAVRSFALGGSAVLLDATTERVVRRFTGRRRSGRWETRLDIYRLAADEGPSPRFNLALLDLGSRVCRTKRPSCSTCPLKPGCASARSRQSEGG
jgi:DNA (cytosine-5)-methyltransferase 1